MLMLDPALGSRVALTRQNGRVARAAIDDEAPGGSSKPAGPDMAVTIRPGRVNRASCSHAGFAAVIERLSNVAIAAVTTAAAPTYVRRDLTAPRPRRTRS